MSNIDPNYQDPEGQDPEGGEQKVTIDRSHIRALEKKAKKGDDAERIQRENTLLKLGVDTDSPGGKLLLDNANLPWDKPEEIGEIAKGVNAMRAAAAGQEIETDDQKIERERVEAELKRQADERSAASSGGLTDDGKPREDPRRSALEEAKKSLSGGAKEEEAMGHYLATIAKAAQDGDKRVLVDQGN